MMKLLKGLTGKRTKPRESENGGGGTTTTTPTTPWSAIQETETQMSKKSRRIFVNVEPKDPKGRPINQYFCSNKVHTTKYTFLTFLPKNLFEQYRSAANFYFTSLVILQVCPEFKFVDPSLTAAPILIILFATAIKDALEDYRRHRADRDINNSKTYVLRSPNVAMDESDEVKESFETKLIRIIRTVLFTYILIPLGLIKSNEQKQNEDLINQQPPVLLPADYLHHEKPKRVSTAFRPSTIQPPTTEPYWKLKTWDNVKVGDFVLIRSNQSIPADVVILSTSEPDGVCYVETKNLDGETNLKIRRGVQELSYICTPQHCTEVKAFIDVEAPNELMYNFNASIRLNPTDPSVPRLSVTGPRASVDRKQSVVTNSSEQLIPVTINGVLLRGCIIRNTDWVIGVVVYTGSDTKLMRNAGITPSKRSRIDRQLNPQILLNFMILFAMCFICAVLGALYQTAFNRSNVPFAFTSKNEGPEGNPAYTAVKNFFLCMIIFQNIVPIALYISIDVCKIVQSALIHFDDEMYDPEADKHALPRTWNLCDDLGQIEYIFSDKTGTLTSNIMEFRKCSINGVMYGNSYVTEAQTGAAKRAGASKTIKEEDLKNKRQLDEEQMRETMTSFFNTKYVSDEPFSFIDPDLHRHLKRGGDQAMAIKQFFALLSVCHTVLAEKYEDDENAVMYKAQSPDEKALVEAARDNGFAFVKRENNSVVVDLLGEEQKFTILHVIEFNSDRKRMSVIIKPPPAMNLNEGDVLLFCKGADSIIYERLGKDSSKELKTLTTTHLELFANDGLRTLCLCYRIVPKNIYQPWAERYRAAQALIKDRDKETDFVADEIERNMVLMGATAIEDKLQDGVPQSIALLAKAGIKIWVLTGDKMETAINIGFSCNLLQKNMILIVVKAKSVEDTQKQLNDAINKFWDENGHPREDKSLALIIDGDSLTFAFDQKNDRKKVRQATLLELACRCKAVICCRVSPLQKAQVVGLVRKGLGAMCLAIGDGANDVSMIQEADVGIGISGKEGLQAVMASDYAIAQFRFLSRLLLVHGRWAYLRISEMILLYFYKNVVWLFILFWYQFDSGFTGDIITDFTYGMFFNTVFTLLPNMLVGFYDQDVNDTLSFKYPGLYGKGIRQELYNMERFWLYTFDGIYQSIVAYYGAMLIFGEGTVNQNGLIEDKNSIGTAIALYSIITVNIYMGLDNFSWTWLTHISVYASILAFVIYVLIYVTNSDSPNYGQLRVLFTEPQLYFGIILIVVTSLLPRIASKAIQGYFMPNDTDIIQEIQKFNISVAEDEVSLSDEVDSLMSSANTQDFSQSLIQARLIHSQEQPTIPEDVEKGDKPYMPSSADEIVVKTAEKEEPTSIKSRSYSNLSSTKPTPQGISPVSGVGGLAISTNVTGTAVVPEIRIEPSIPSAERKRRSFFSSAEIRTDILSKDNEKPPISAPLAGSTSTSGTTSGRVRRNSQSVGNAISDMFLQPLSLMGRNVGDFMKNMPKKLRIGSLSALSKLEKATKSPSLIYMGTHQELPNTGFCFSHEEGMEEVITPNRGNTQNNFEERLSYQLFVEKPEYYMVSSPGPRTAPPALGSALPMDLEALAATIPSIDSPYGPGPSTSGPKPILSKETYFPDGGQRRMSRRTSRVTFNIPTELTAGVEEQKKSSIVILADSDFGNFQKAESAPSSKSESPSKRSTDDDTLDYKPPSMPTVRRSSFSPISAQSKDLPTHLERRSSTSKLSPNSSESSSSGQQMERRPSSTKSPGNNNSGQMQRKPSTSKLSVEQGSGGATKDKRVSTSKLSEKDDVRISSFRISPVQMERRPSSSKLTASNQQVHSGGSNNQIQRKFSSSKLSLPTAGGSQSERRASTSILAPGDQNTGTLSERKTSSSKLSSNGESPGIKQDRRPSSSLLATPTLTVTHAEKASSSSKVSSNGEASGNRQERRPSTSQIIPPSLTVTETEKASSSSKLSSNGEVSGVKQENRPYISKLTLSENESQRERRPSASRIAPVQLRAQRQEEEQRIPSSPTRLSPTITENGASHHSNRRPSASRISPVQMERRLSSSEISRQQPASNNNNTNRFSSSSPQRSKSQSKDKKGPSDKGSPSR